MEKAWMQRIHCFSYIHEITIPFCVQVPDLHLRDRLIHCSHRRDILFPVQSSSHMDSVSENCMLILFMNWSSRVRMLPWNVESWAGMICANVAFQLDFKQGILRSLRQNQLYPVMDFLFLHSGVWADWALWTAIEFAMPLAPADIHRVQLDTWWFPLVAGVLSTKVTRTPGCVAMSAGIGAFVIASHILVHVRRVSLVTFAQYTRL